MFSLEQASLVPKPADYSCSQASKLSLFPIQHYPCSQAMHEGIIVLTQEGYPCSQSSRLFLFTSQLPILGHKPVDYPCSQASRLSLFNRAGYPCSQAMQEGIMQEGYSCSQASRLSFFTSQHYPCSQARKLSLCKSQQAILLFTSYVAGYPCYQSSRLSLSTSQQTILLPKPADYLILVTSVSSGFKIPVL